MNRQEILKKTEQLNEILVLEKQANALEESENMKIIFTESFYNNNFNIQISEDEDFELIDFIRKYFVIKLESKKKEYDIE